MGMAYNRTKKMIENVCVLFCPPLSKFKEQPIDMSRCELVDCPKCNEKMWLSEKKKSIKLFCEENKKEFIFCCYDCFEEMVKQIKESVSVRVDI